MPVEQKAHIKKRVMPGDLPSASERHKIQRRLLSWFARSQRDLPWRRDRDPYRIWVSEIMLQQTQVVTVIPYFQRFVRAFPTVAALAGADEQAVLRLWEGLGYYRRARDMHQAARVIMNGHDGEIPQEPASLLSLPGIGRYTAGAILSQAFERRLPILEANSRRVLCRLYGRRDDPQRGPLRAWLWKLAEALLPARRVGEFNQALMELGALVCTPAAPKCTSCPLAALCAAQRLGIQETIPFSPPPPRPLAIEEAAVVVRRNGAVCLGQRPKTGRWAGLWEFPHAPVQKGESHDQAAARFLPELTGFDVELGAELMTLRHSITHHRIRLVCFEARHRRGRFYSRFYQQGRWVKPTELSAFPVSSPQRRLALMLVNPDRQRRLF
ncbi:MAG TPA: A/G-specific adenine glycosylase [Gemmataceae bacterium]|nr:A/G-specific adenine glycosylase [Gemmataceae bacterium]